MQYPILLIPEELGAALSYYPPLPKKPVEPIPPRQPQKPTDQDGLSLFLSFLMVPFGGASFAIFFGEYLIGVCGIIGWIILVSILSSIERKGDKHSRELNKFHELHYEYITYKNQYPALMEKYNEQVKHVLGSLTEIRNKKYYFSLGNYTSPIPIHPEENHRKGKYEDILYKKLKNIYQENIYNNIALSLNNVQYKPDIVFWDGALIIDIEIDEPYEYENGEPIHFIGKDDLRNNRFVSNGWNVIRFSESQVANECDACISCIRLFITHLCSQNINLIPILADLANLTKVPQWTKEEAYKMAYKRIRDSYHINGYNFA